MKFRYSGDLIPWSLNKGLFYLREFSSANLHLRLCGVLGGAYSGLPRAL